MRSRAQNWIRVGIILTVMAGTQTGCKTGWKMPGADMFSWSRKPSESTLTGAGPSMSVPSSTPQSPALKSTPSQIAATTPSRPTSPYGTSSLGSGVPAGAGAAATANGYSTGQLATNGARTAAATPPTHYAPTAGFGPTPPTGAGYPTAGVPNYANNLAAPGVGAPAGYGTVPPPGGAQPYGLPQNPNLTAGLPPATTSYGVPSYSPVGGSSVPAMPTSYSNPGLPPNLSNPSSMPIATGTVPSNGASALPAANMASSNNAYAPGSTKRPTGYDFSTQGPGVSAPGSVPAYPSGAGYPRTATEPGTTGAYR